MSTAEQSPEGERPRLLITGANGALTRRVIELLEPDYELVAIDFRRRPTLPPGLERIPTFRVDFNKREAEDLFRDHRFAGVIHLGRMVKSDHARRSRYNANVRGTQRMFKLCSKYGVSQVVVLSTFYVYGAHPYNPALLEEDAPLKAAELTYALVDSVELENLSQIYLWKHPELNITILRPCNIIGPGVRNTISTLLSRRYSPCLAGFSPMMQFLHVEDVARAICTAYRQNCRGVYNVAPEDWVPYQVALEAAGCVPVPLPSIPDALPRALSYFTGKLGFPRHLVNYFKYPAIIDGTLFSWTFGWSPQRTLDEAFAHYRALKEAGVS
ncbi:MAG: SDR family oxidoreductase [Myxococcales bacterium]|nr:SDR family oxidoreductase [Myxococcales bacterium]